MDLLIANAGIMAAPETRVGPGWEAQFAINHFSGMRWDDMQFERGYDEWAAYGQAKTANVLFAVQLDRYASRRDVRAFALHPGQIMTNLARFLTHEEMVELGFVDEHGNTLGEFKTIEQGAATQVWPRRHRSSPDWAGSTRRAATSPNRRSRDRQTVSATMRSTPPRRPACGPLSAELTGVDAFA